ncbi:hypothetical protein ACFVRB_12710 [Streptomyces nojiriensis]|uniref:hypothetical protein n=1 Tax=Streptomyces nojiriensis TaxID=66374 RepID=UPI0036DDF06C
MPTASETVLAVLPSHIDTVWSVAFSSTPCARDSCAASQVNPRPTTDTAPPVPAREQPEDRRRHRRPPASGLPLNTATGQISAPHRAGAHLFTVTAPAPATDLEPQVPPAVREFSLTIQATSALTCANAPNHPGHPRRHSDLRTVGDASVLHSGAFRAGAAGW